MKNYIKKFLAIILVVPLVFLCSCGEISKLDSIDVSVYIESDVSATIYGETSTTKTLSLSTLTADTPNTLYYDSYVELELTGISSWIYKMYIDYITFYVYASSDAAEEMTVNLTITNLADEDDIENPEECTFISSAIIKKETPALYTFKINKTVATATSTTLTLDILNSVNGTVADSQGESTSFRWIIYGLTIYGESRAYSS